MANNNNSNSKSEGVKFRMPDLIRKKRDGQEDLTMQEINWFINNVVGENGECDDAQLGALLMAIYQNGMSLLETEHLTSAMMHSGDILQWPESWKGKLVDKHSTGGVGDKISLVLAPALAACGMKVPMISGRGLGHTGGTLDKLESIPGFNIYFEQKDMIYILENVGCCIVGQSGNLVPADKKLYATRDVTATVESLPLIAGSIISKKAAESIDALILDVKCGKAAFMKNETEGRKLAKALVNAGVGLGIKTLALLTNMENPIGYTIGNSLEVAECLQCLQGHGPEDLMELVCQLGGHLLSLTDSKTSSDEGIDQIRTALSDGSAMKKFQQLLIAQGVDATLAKTLCENDMKCIDNVWKHLRKAEHETDIKILQDGYVTAIDAYEIAVATQLLGAGRAVAADTIDHSVGVRLLVCHGSTVKKGDTWIRVYHKESVLSDATISSLQKSLHIVDSEVTKTSRIIDVINAD